MIEKTYEPIKLIIILFINIIILISNTQTVFPQSEEGVILKMHFDGNVNDSSGNDLHGTWYSGTTQNAGESYATGISGQALNLDGTNYVRISGHDTLGGMNNLLVSIWAKKASLNASGYLFYKALQYDLYFQQTHNVWGHVFNNESESAYVQTKEYDAEDTLWHNYILSYDGSVVRLLIDNEQVYHDVPLTGQVRIRNSYLFIGVENSTEGGFQGLIDELLILAGDSIKPGIPAGLSGEAISYARIDLSWDELPGTDYIAGYEIYRDGVCIDSSKTNLYNDFNKGQGLNPEQSYNYQVRSYNLLGNKGSLSGAISVTTPAQTGSVESTIISQFDEISWEILGELEYGVDYGQFANGDYWVVGPVQIINITPKSRELQQEFVAGNINGTFEQGDSVTQANTGATGRVIRVDEGTETVIYINPINDDVLFDKVNSISNETGSSFIPSKITWRAMNGSMINPALSPWQGYDSKVLGGTGAWKLDEKFNDHPQRTYDSELNVGVGITEANPLLLDPGISLISSVSDSNALTGGYSVLKTAAILTVIDSPPPDGSFRPAYTSSDKTIKYNINQLQTGILKELPAPSDPENELNDLDINEMLRYFERPWIDHAASGPMLEYMKFPENSPGYGRPYAAQTGIGTLLLNVDFASLGIEEIHKETLLIRIVQIGIDIYSILINGGKHRWIGGGGHNAGRKWPILFTGIMLGDEDMKSSVRDPNNYFEEDQQTYYGKGWHGYRALGTGGNHVLNPEGDHEHTHPREWTVDGGDRGPRPVSAKNFTELEEEAGNPELHVFNDLLSRGYIDAQGNVLSTFDMYNYDDFVIDETYANVRSKIFVVLRQHLADPPIIGLNSDIRAEYYRLGNALAWVGTAMSAILMETTDEWGHQPYFDYIDRWMNEDYYAYEDTLIKYCSRRVGIENGWIDRDYRITYYTNANPSHALDRLMWEEYRLDYDTTAPTTPVISLAGKTLTQVDISIDAWDSYGVYYYRIFRDGNFLCEVSESYYSDTGLTPYTEYTYTATAYDIAGNESDLSEPLQVTTSDIDEISDMNHGIFEIYPNPASSLIFLESFSTTSLYFELYTVTGIKLLQQTISIKKQTIDISKFSEGIYVYKVYAADNHYKSGMLMINR